MVTSEIRQRALNVRTTSWVVGRQSQPIFALRLERMRTPLGELLLLTDEAGNLRALDFQDCQERMQRLLRLHYGVGGVHVAEQTARTPSRALAALSAYFEGDLRALRDLPVATSGTPFQREVWACLRSVEVGKTASYGEVAAAIGRTRAVRAVGLANGANPVGIVVPCHRVIGAGATLTGYAGGLERKRWLLKHEGAL